MWTQSACSSPETSAGPSERIGLMRRRHRPHVGRHSEAVKKPTTARLVTLLVDLAGEPFCMPPRRAALHIDDLAVAEGKHLVALLPRAVLVYPLCRADDHVVADAGESWPDIDSTVAVLVDLEGQDLTGLVGPASGRPAFPPEVAVRDATPFTVVGDQVGERARVASMQCVRRSLKFLDHDRIMPSAEQFNRARALHLLGSISARSASRRARARRPRLPARGSSAAVHELVEDSIGAGNGEAVDEVVAEILRERRRWVAPGRLVDVHERK